MSHKLDFRAIKNNDENAALIQGRRRSDHDADISSGQSVWLCSLFGSRSLVDWIVSTAASRFNRRNVKLTIIDQVRKTGTVLSMSECLLGKVTLPALDKASSADAFMRLVVKPERWMKTALGEIQAISIPPPKEPSKVSEFEFVIDGLDDAKFVQRVESVTLEQGIKVVYEHDSSLSEPTKISDSNIVISLPVQNGTGFLKWSDETGNSGNLREKTGAVRYLANKKVALQANLYELSLIRTTRSGPSLKVEMACGRMDFDGGHVDF